MACTLPYILQTLFASGGVSTSSSGLKADARASSGGRRSLWRRQQKYMHLVTALHSHGADNGGQEGPPIIQIDFLDPDARYEPQTFSAKSGEKNLRKWMLENKLDLYGLYGKVMNCGGGGSCGTCIVEILEGQELLSEKTDAEYKYLRKKPESWRLACQTIIGDKTKSGKVVVQQLPKKK